MAGQHTFLYLEIAESIRRLILNGELKAGDKLPSVRDMAQRWHCTPSTVSRAYTILTQEGLVTGRRGGGTTVTSSGLPGEQPVVHWASLVNKAERFLLEAVSGGHTPSQAEAALSLAISRWQDIQRNAAQHASDPPPPAKPTTLRFVGSHDLLIEALARTLPDQVPDASLSVDFTGSLGGLIALTQHNADVAGTHLWDQTTDSYNLPFIRRLMPGRTLVVLGLAERSLGLILPPDNPLQIKQLADLARPGVCLVNRQPGSGTRVWLDAQLKSMAVDTTVINGYHDEKLTHLAVARAIAEGKANVGLGIFAAATAYDLSFVPLTRERYDLVFTEPVWESPTAQALVELVRSPQFKETIVTLGGYDASITGQETLLS